MIAMLPTQGSGTRPGTLSTDPLALATLALGRLGLLRGMAFGGDCTMGWLRRWWGQDEQFDWFSAYVKSRELETVWRAAIFGFTAAVAVIPIVMLHSPTGPDQPLTRMFSVAAAGVGAGCAILWLVRWPTRVQSIVFSMVATVTVAASCLVQSDPYVGLAGCTILAMIGGFVAYFHAAAQVVLHVTAAIACSLALMLRLIADTGDAALAGSAFAIVALLNIGVPFGIHSLVHALRDDLRRSDRDSLTGLLNRREFEYSSYELAVRHHGVEGAYLVTAMVDLDDFKRLNDTHGHAVGDQALASVGQALRDTCGPMAVIGRVGGEEFVIADVHSGADPTAMAERLRHRIADVPLPVTASIGTASAPMSGMSAAVIRQVLFELIGIADAAMYEAKRSGGNQTRHRPISTIGGVDGAVDGGFDGGFDGDGRTRG